MNRKVVKVKSFNYFISFKFLHLKSKTKADIYTRLVPHYQSTKPN
jgi:hypothetical protein